MNKLLDINNKYIKIILIIIFLAVGLFAAEYLVRNVWQIFSKFLVWFLPFVIALLLSYTIEPLIVKFENRLDRRITAGIILLLINVVVIGILAVCVTTLTVEIIELQDKLPDYTKYIQHEFVYLDQNIKRIFINLPAPIANLGQNGMDKLMGIITQLASKSLYILNVVPSAFKSMLVWFISNFIAYLILRDNKKTNLLFRKRLTNSVEADLVVINVQILKAVLGFIKSQVILIFIMFIVSSLCLLIIGSPYIIILSILIGIASVVPVIGTGTIFIPYIIIKFIGGDVIFGIKLSIVYVLTIFIREFVVVKVVSQNVGLDLLSTIISMYVGIEIFGGFGFIIGPLLLIIILVILRSNLMDKIKSKFNII